MTSTLDRTNLSDRKAMMIVTETAKSLGHNVSELALNRQTIRRSRQKYRQNLCAHLKQQFTARVPLVIHWDGKLLRDITGQEHVDRLPIIIKGASISQLLTVAKLPSGTGEAQAKAVCDAVNDWDVQDQVVAMSFDTTSSNTGKLNGACVLIEQTLQKNLLHLACRHHMYELVIGAVISTCLGQSCGPEVPLFKRFQTQWHFLDQGNYQDASTDETVINSLREVRGSVVSFIRDQLDLVQPRDDYRELLELTLIFLGETPARGARFMKPGAMHQARWMSKVLYSFKMFRNQFHLTPREEKGLRDICIFIVYLYVKAWITCPKATSAPANDLQFLKDLVSYEVIHPEISKTATKKFLNHLWYLSEELVGLALFDEAVDIEVKREIIQRIKNSNESEEQPAKRAQVNPKFIMDQSLDNFASKKSLILFQLFGIPVDLLENDVVNWSQLPDFQEAKQKMTSLSVVNDHAERGVALIEEFSGHLTKDEEQLQFILQVVQAHRRAYPDTLKRMLQH